MWACPACAESLDEAFDTCWKCGTDRAGNKNSAFAIVEPVEEPGQAVESVDDQRGKQIQIPDITYYTIPVWCCWAAVRTTMQLYEYVPGAVWPSPPTTLDILVMAAFALVIGLPLLFAALQIFRNRIHDRRMPWQFLWDFLGVLRPPRQIRHRYRWFGVIYYSSIVAYLLSPVAALFARFLR
jgi:hypothetical protein